MHEHDPEGRHIHAHPAVIARTLLAHGVHLELQAGRPSVQDTCPLTEGERLPHRGAGDRLRFQFSRATRGPKVGSRGRLELDGHPPASARVRQRTEEHVELAVATWIDGPIPDGCFVEDPRWIMESLRTRLLSSFHGRKDQLALAVLGIPLHRPNRRSDPIPFDPSLNTEQHTAVEVGLQPGLTLLHGPPGTGKTFTLGALTDAAVARRRTVLCAAPSNVAVDKLLQSVCERLEKSGRLSDGTVIRLGPVTLPEVRSRWRSKVDPWHLALTRVADPADLGAVRQEANRLIRSSEILVTTVARTHLTDLRRTFDLVVLDEAVMTPLPSIYHTATYAAQGGSLLLAGDPHQLPAVVRSRNPMAARFFAGDPFATVEASVASGKPSGVIVRLRTQYRMDPPIAATANGLAYAGLLRTAPEVRCRPPLPNGDHLLLVDSSDVAGVDTGARRGVGRHGNRTHAELIARVVRRLRTDDAIEPGRVAVLTRYRDQVATVREVLRDTPMVLVDTVHGLQGQEVETVILDLSASPGDEWLGDYITDSDPSAVGVRLLNVAITRARRRLIVIANLRYLEGHPGVPPTAGSRRLIKVMRTIGRQMTAADFIGHES